MALSKTGLLARLAGGAACRGLLAAPAFASMNYAAGAAAARTVRERDRLDGPAAAGRSRHRIRPGAVSRPPPAPRPRSPSLPGDAGAGRHAPDITTGNVAAVWNASVSGQSCQVATSLTKLGAEQPRRRRCAARLRSTASNPGTSPASSFRSMTKPARSLARLYSSGPEKFDGQTSTGLAYFAEPLDRSILPSVQ